MVRMEYFNPPPGWPPAPHGWRPPQGWQPDPQWPSAPKGWDFWADAYRRPVAGPEGLYGAETSSSWREARDRLTDAVRNLDDTTAGARRAATTAASGATRAAMDTAANLRERYENRHAEDATTAIPAQTQPVPQNWTHNSTQSGPNAWPASSSSNTWSGSSFSGASPAGGGNSNRFGLLKKIGVGDAALILLTVVISQCTGGSGASSPSGSASSTVASSSATSPTSSATSSSTTPSSTTTSTSATSTPVSSTATQATSSTPDVDRPRTTSAAPAAPRTTTARPIPTTQDVVPQTSAPAVPLVPQQTEDPVEPEADDVDPGGSAYYANCAAVRAAGAAPLHSGDPGYSRKLDRDGDGVACE